MGLLSLIAASTCWQGSSTWVTRSMWKMLVSINDEFLKIPKYILLVNFVLTLVLKWPQYYNHLKMHLSWESQQDSGPEKWELFLWHLERPLPRLGCKKPSRKDSFDEIIGYTLFSGASAICKQPEKVFHGNHSNESYILKDVKHDPHFEEKIKLSQLMRPNLFIR